MEWFALLLYDKLDNFPSVSRWQMNGRGIFSSACFISQSFPIGEGCARAASTMQSCVHVHVLCPMTCSVSDHKLCVWLNVSCIITLLCLIFRACKQGFLPRPWEILQLMVMGFRYYGQSCCILFAKLLLYSIQIGGEVLSKRKIQNSIFFMEWLLEVFLRTVFYCWRNFF